MYLRTFCIYGRFVERTFCQEGRYVEGRFVDGRFVEGHSVEGRFVLVPDCTVANNYSMYSTQVSLLLSVNTVVMQ